ncbi:MAG: DUF2877 domain-containing protein, partial [Actinobacteria bacterium]|nr:DUF2877 domain-containing protein [Actinomycetota bacterium]
SGLRLAARLGLVGLPRVAGALRFEVAEGSRHALLGRAEVLGAEAVDGGLHLAHLVGDLGVAHTGVLHVVEEALEAVGEAVARLVEPAADLTLHDGRLADPLAGLGILEDHLQQLVAPGAPLGRDYLRCAERGELPEPAAAVLTAIRAGATRAASRRASRLAGWGASSGAALLWGLAAGASDRATTHQTPAQGPGSGREDGRALARPPDEA